MDITVLYIHQVVKNYFYMWNKKVPVFHREIALFFTKNFVRRVPQNSRNGCVLQAAYSAPGAAATKRTRKRRSNRRKSRRNSK